MTDLPNFEADRLTVPSACKRCPRLSWIIEKFSEISDSKLHIMSDHGPEDFGRNAGKLIMDSDGRITIEQIADDDERQLIGGLAMDQMIGQKQALLDKLEATKDAVIDSCPGVCDIATTTEDGEYIGVTVCRSPMLREADTGTEPTQAMIYRRLTD